MAKPAATVRKKRMYHDGCGGSVSHKTLACDRCGKRPPGSQVSLVRRNP